MATHLALVIQIHDYLGDSLRPAFMDAAVQVWDEQTHVADIDLVSRRHCDTPELSGDFPIEQWAAREAGIIKDRLEAEMLAHVHTGSLHYLNDFKMVTQVTTDKK